MKICLVPNKKVNEHFKTESVNADLVVFSMLGEREINFKKELEGKSEKLSTITQISKDIDGGIFCGCITDTYGQKRKSVAIANKGKLLGVTDRKFKLSTDDYASGGGDRVFSIGERKIGLLVAEDLFFYEISKSLVDVGCDMLVCVFDTETNHLPLIVMRSIAFCEGVPCALVSCNHASLISSKGDVVESKNSTFVVEDYFEIKTFQDITYKKKGNFKVDLHM